VNLEIDPICNLLLRAVDGLYGGLCTEIHRGNVYEAINWPRQGFKKKLEFGGVCSASGRVVKLKPDGMQRLG